MLGACHAEVVRRFPLAPPLWQDPDRNPVPRRPAEYISGLYFDTLDESLFRPVIDPLGLPLGHEAVNVNALDEVPDSSWFKNRIGMVPMSPQQVARGNCGSSDIEGVRGPWQVTSAKEEGVTPGFFVKAAGGQRYLFKLDSPTNQPKRDSAADVIASRIYHAVGFHTPCNQVVTFRPGDLTIAAGADYQNDRGQRRILTREHFDKILDQGLRLGDGRYRAMASRLLEGEPIGPHVARGRRHDDPNDVIPHEDRRELRGERLLAAWLGRFDTRDQNSLDMWVHEGGRHFVRHYQIDFGDAFGGEWEGADRLNRSVGHSYYFDLGQITTDLFTLGAISRPWYGPRPAPGGATFGYYGWEDFHPSRWKSIIPFPPFKRMTWRDGLWMIRRIVSFSDEHLRAVVREGRLDPPDESYLVQALIERRNRIAAAYLRRYVPLAGLALSGAGDAPSVCFADLGIRHAWVDPSRVVYRVRLLAGRRLERTVGSAVIRPGLYNPDRTCTRLPLDGPRPAALLSRQAPDDDALRYAVLEIAVERPYAPPSRLRVHLYDLGARRGFVLAGLERL